MGICIVAMNPTLDLNGLITVPFRQDKVRRMVAIGCKRERAEALRVKKMAENGLALAKFFESHPKVEKVYYPGLESSPSKALADKQFEGNGYGGMLCVNFKGGQKEIDKLISNLQLVRFVPTLAGVGTTLTYPPRASHRDLSPDELAAIGITMGQIRLSSGLEDTDDLLNDFDQALAKM